MEMPVDVQLILEALDNHGHQAYVVGGCVRDSIMGKNPKDWDIATSMRPEVVMETFKKIGLTVIPTGIKHGTVTIVVDGEHYEVTTFRKDGEYTDGRRPDEVEYSISLREDLSRRDFTMNAIAYNEKNGFVDPFDGIYDIEKGVLQTVGDANKRFQEDALRMLRAIRFSCTHHLKIMPSTMFAILENSYLIHHVSMERKRDELTKIIVSSNATNGMMMLRLSGLLDKIIPEISCMSFDLLDDLLDSQRLPYLLCDTSNFREIMNKLKFDNKETKFVCNIITAYQQIKDFSEVPSRLELKKLIIKYGEKELHWAFSLGHHKKTTTPFSFRSAREIRDIVRSGEPLYIKDLAVNGNDLIELGCSGMEIGTCLRIMLEWVLENPQMNTKEHLLAKGGE